jgi:hypothetical protein
MSEDDEPLSDVREEVERRRSENGADDEEDAFDTAFREVEVSTDDEAVWRALSGDDDGDAAESALDDRSERVVDKRHYCHRCEHFSEPPEMACTHEGTEIRELVDVEHVRVYGCPVVREREELGDVD